MSYVLTIIANPDKKEIDQNDLDLLLPFLNDVALDERGFISLSDREAYDFYISKDIELAKLKITAPHFDFICQRAEGRKKKFLIADMDSTIVTGETLDDLAEFAGIKEQVAEITTRAMNGELDFREALNERVAMLKGLSAYKLEEAMRMVELTDGAQTLVGTMKANGAYCALVSGGFTFFTSRVADLVRFDFNAGNNMEIVDGAITGRVIEPIVTKESKLAYLKSLSAERGWSTQEAVAVGDGANDLPMLLEAGLGIAFHAKPSVVEKANHNVQHADLRALLFAQGYKADEFTC